LLNVNFNELNHKQQQRKKKIAAIEEGDNIATVTFFTAKITNERQRSPFPYSKAIEEGSRMVMLMDLQRHTKEWVMF